MLTLLVGKPGAGKSLKAVKDFVIKVGVGVKEKASRGGLKGKAGKAPRYVLTNIPLNLDLIDEHWPGAAHYIQYVDEIDGDALPFANIENLKRWTEEFRNETGEGPLFVIDEAHISFARGQTPKETLNFFTLHRKFGCDILLVTQQVSQIDRNIAGLAEVYIILNRNRTIGLAKDSYQEIIRDGYPKGAVVSTKNGKHDKRYFQYYGSHFASGIAEAEGKVKPLWTRWQILLPAILMPLALGYAIMAGYPAITKVMGGNKPTKSTVEEVEVAPPGDIPSTAPQTIAVPPPITQRSHGVAGEGLTTGFATSAENFTDGLSELGVLAVPGSGERSQSEPTWSIVSWTGYQNAAGEDVCKTRFAINGTTVMLYDAKMTMGWEDVTWKYDRASGECITTIQPKENPAYKSIPEEQRPPKPDPIVISNRE